MRFEMIMPDASTTESQVRIVRWLVEPGQAVERGQPLLEVETDKATIEVEAVVSGVLHEVRSRADDMVAAGEVIAVLEIESAAPAATPAGPAADLGAIPPSAVPSEPARMAAPSAGEAVGMFARNRASARAAVGIPLTVPQRVAARRLQESKQTIPHFYLQTSVNATAIVARRRAAEPVKLVWDAFVVLAVAKAINKFDRFRYRFDGERLALIENDTIGVAVDHDNELYVIPIASPATKLVEQISDEIRHGAERLRSGVPEAKRIHPAVLTVTNLGACMIESFIPIINPPEAAILGVGRVLPTPVARTDTEIGIEQRCKLTLSVDHRVSNGRYAAQFLSTIVGELESM